MKHPNIDLHVIESSGPRGQEEGTPCVCDGPIVAGDLISKTAFGWEHKGCAEDTLRVESAPRAWVALGLDAARSPRSYGVTQLRAIITSLIDIIGGAERDHEKAYFEALVYAFQKRVDDASGERVGTCDPIEFARRYAEGDWSDAIERRLPLEDAYAAAWAEIVEDTKPEATR
jgi:hypothetical protein